MKSITAGSGADVLTTDSTLATIVINAGSGNDTVDIGGAATGTIDGGDGTDTLSVTAAVDISGATLSSFELLDINNLDVTVDESLVNGQSTVIRSTGGGAETITLDNITASTDLSGLSFADAFVTMDIDYANNLDGTLGANAAISVIGSSAADVIVGGGGADTLLGGAGADNITGGAGNDYIDGGAAADTLLGGDGVDTIIGGEGGDTITGGLGADIINLTETTAATDIVVLTTGGAIAVDSITGFAVGATNGDEIDIDLSDINALVADVVLPGALGTDLAADNAPVLTTITAAFDLGTAATTEILVVSGDFSASTLETALEVGGTRALTGSGTLVAGDGFLVAYDDGTDSYLAFVVSAAGIADDATFVSGDLTVTNIVKLVGVADATTLVSANIDIIA